MSTPTLAGFIEWAASAMGVTSTILPSTSPYWGYAFDVAMAIVNQQLATASSTVYMLAVYNLAGDNLVNWAQDPTPVVVYQNNQGYFTYSRASFGCFNFVPGVINVASDQATAADVEVIESLKNLTLGQLQNLKTPWGRQYLAFASSVGEIWGIT